MEILKRGTPRHETAQNRRDPFAVFDCRECGSQLKAHESEGTMLDDWRHGEYSVMIKCPVCMAEIRVPGTKFLHYDKPQVQSDVLNPWAQPGTKVRPIYQDGQPLHGYEADRRKVAQWLKEDGVYTIDRTEVDRFHTDVYLKEVPGVRFNSVCFTEANSIQ